MLLILLLLLLSVYSDVGVMDVVEKSLDLALTVSVGVTVNALVHGLNLLP